MPYEKISFKDAIPMSKQMRLFTYDEVREFNMPFYKRSYASEKTDLATNGYVDMVTQRIQKIGWNKVLAFINIIRLMIDHLLHSMYESSRYYFFCRSIWEGK